MNRMPRREMLLWAGLAIAGVVCEAMAAGSLQVADTLTGLSLVAAGLAARLAGRESRVGPMLGVTSAVWFLGSVWSVAATAHLGPLVHTFLSAPRGRLRGLVERAVVAAAYADGVLQGVQRSDTATMVVSAALVAVVVGRWLRDPRGRRWIPGLATVGIGFALAVGAIARAAGVGDERLLLSAYELAVAGGALAIAYDLARQRWEGSVVTGLVVDLGDAPERGTLRDALAGALRDPTLEIGIWSRQEHAFVDERGAPLTLPDGDRRSSTVVTQDSEQVAVIVHDAGVLTDPRLVESATAATRVAVTNSRLRSELLAHVQELEASRLRVIESADTQRRLLATLLRDGAEQRLDRVAVLTSRIDPAFERELAEARAELADLARGIYPSVLSEHGFATAILQLAARSPVPVVVDVDNADLVPAVEAALYFVCSEALTNVAKHANADGAQVTLSLHGGVVRLAVCDDGVGGVDPGSGAGLRGLTDRVEALDGRMRIESAPGMGTSLWVEVPL
jgi:signal transduction histidine kinase